MIDTDVLDLVARYAPTPDSLAREWSPAHRASVLDTVVDDAGSAPAEIPLRFVPVRTPRRWARVLPLASGAAVLAVAAGVLVAVVPDGSGSDDAGGPLKHGPVFDPPAGLSAKAIGAHQFSYRVVQQLDLGADGRPKANGMDAMIDRSYVAANGDIVSFRTGQQQGCFRFPATGPADWDSPSAGFFAKLPTDIGRLTAYLRAHVSGSSSHDEAVFVAVGDALRTADGLASPRLRAALLGVLSRTPGVTVHPGQRDYLGRPALRADFVDQRIRPGEVQSLYFAAGTFQLAEERTWSNGQPGVYHGPSPAYGAHPSVGTDPAQVTGPSYVAVMTTERVVDKLPTLPAHCGS